MDIADNFLDKAAASGTWLNAGSWLIFCMWSL
jgi:hypothetical protein